MTDTAASTSTELRAPLDVLGEVERRVLWLSTAMVDHANRVRPNRSGVKVGGHQASSASMVSIMTALWFTQLRAIDRVSVKPHASPVLHAINYLLGDLGEEYLDTLRSRGGLQPYPSRTKDPDTVDFSLVLNDREATTLSGLLGGARFAENLDRLKRTKRHYDPHDVFRGNHQVPPAASA